MTPYERWEKRVAGDHDKCEMILDKGANKAVKGNQRPTTL